MRSVWGLTGLILLSLVGCEKPTAKDLFTAIQTQRLDHVQRFVKKDKALLSAKDETGATPLLVAAGIGNKAIVEVLLKGGADPNVRDSKGNAPLHIGIETGNNGNASLLIESGADLKAVDSIGRTPLYLAASKGNDAILKELLKKGADFKKLDSDGETALHAAIRSRKLEAVQTLVDAGADLSIRDRAGRKTVELAGDEGSWEIFGYLQEKGEKPVYDSSIHAAIGDGDLAKVRKILEAKSYYVNVEGGRGNRPLHYACMGDRADIAQLLFQKGADPEPENGVGNTPLHECSFLGSEKVTRLLLQRKSNLNRRNRKGETALLVASREGRSGIVGQLLQAGADPKVADNLERTAIEWAVNSACGKCVDLLMTKGALPDQPLLAAILKGEKTGISNPEISDHLGQTAAHYAAFSGSGELGNINAESKITKVTPLHLAAAQGNVAVVQVLLEKGANINALTTSGDTALHFAVDKNLSTGVIKILIKAKIDRTVQNERGETALDIAEFRSENEKDPKLVKAAKEAARLIEKGAD